MKYAFFRLLFVKLIDYWSNCWRLKSVKKWRNQYEITAKSVSCSWLTYEILLGSKLIAIKKKKQEHCVSSPFRTYPVCCMLHSKHICVRSYLFLALKVSQSSWRLFKGKSFLQITKELKLNQMIYMRWFFETRTYIEYNKNNKNRQPTWSN